MVGERIGNLLSGNGRDDFNLSPGFREETRPVVVTDEERLVGVEAKRIFDRQIKRITPWIVIEDKGLFILKPQRGAFDPADYTSDQLRAISVEVITADAISREIIPQEVADVIFTFKRIEDKLPDFTGRSADLFRNYWGINNSYHQWTREEMEHSNAEALVLTATGSLTKEQIVEDYLDNLSRTWEAPFLTPRQMVLYAYFQELLTNRNYVAVSETLEKEGAANIATVMRIIAKDEAYHAGGYRKFAQIFAKFDLEGTIQDACYVALNFRMPAMHLMRDQKRDSLNIVRAGAFSKWMVSEETIFRGLKGLGFVAEEKARQIADSYWKHQRKVTHSQPSH